MPRLLVRVLQRVANADPTRMLASLPPGSCPVLLDSSDGGGASLLAWEPDRNIQGKLTARSSFRTSERSSPPDVRGPLARWSLAEQDPGLILEQATRDECWELEDSSLPLVGGWIGFMSFECGHAWEPFPWLPPDPAGFDDYHFARYRKAVLFQPNGEALLLWTDDLSASSEIRHLERAALMQQFQVLLNAPPLFEDRVFLPKAPRPTASSDTYQNAVIQLRKWIGSGELFQANLSHRLEGPAPVDPRAFYASLRPRQPTAMSSYWEAHDGAALLSWSPESFLSVRGRNLCTKPIKGTAPRGANAAQDAQFSCDLDASIKERAELNMIVDMARNDLGRVADPGKVRLATAGKVTPFPTLFHRIAEVRAEWNPARGLGALMRATFPPASVTGAPKVRALQAIAELESTARGPYCGVFGYWLPGEPRAEFSVLIRTSTLAKGRLSLRVGAGIVWDSNPLQEWKETLVKALYLTETHEQTSLRSR